VNQYADIVRRGCVAVKLGGRRVRDRDGSAGPELLQVMPWPVFGQMTDRDLEAIYAYLTTIPHAEPAAP
jgi:hypothetical protein